MFSQKNSLNLFVKPGLNALHEVRQMRLSYLVERFASFLFAGQESAALHQPQVFRCHVTWDAAGFGQFSNCVPTSEKHLNNSQPVWVR
jgi:hypothetical protein